jgi:DNA-binding LacI/PurR family transcriptional regulator
MRLFGPTQKDIAEALQLSQSTVALALNPKQQHKLQPETVAHIQAKAVELGYRPQKLARILRSGRSHTIGVVYRQGHYHAPQERVKFLAQQAIRAGYQLIAVDLDWFGKDNKGVQDYLLGAAVEGVVLVNLPLHNLETWEEFFRDRGLPVVSLSSLAAECWDDAQADLETAFFEMAQHHLAQGSRRLTLLTSFHDKGFRGPSFSTILGRVNGFSRAVREAGGSIVADEETRNYLLLKKEKAAGGGLVGEIYSPVRTEEHHSAFELGRVVAEQMILENRHTDSLICNNDEIAAGAMAACLHYGTQVPGALKISGADDAPFSRYCGVPLTTIRQPSEEMTRWCIERIVQLIENPAERTRPQKRTFPCELVFRRSSGVFSEPLQASRSPQGVS